MSYVAVPILDYLVGICEETAKDIRHKQSPVELLPAKHQC